jgi:hypothetical protein
VKKPLILFVNGGRTDLQVVIEENKQLYRVETAKDNLREFHQALLDSHNGINCGQAYQITEPERLMKKHGDYDAIWANKQLELKDREKREKRENAKDSDPKPEIVTDEQGYIQLVPAKLLRVVEKLKSDYQVVKVVIFYTHRENDKQEPIAVGKILADWLKKYFGLTDNVFHVNILPNRKRIEGPDDRDYPVNRFTVKIIDKTVRELAESADKNSIACVSAAGMQDIKNIIKACVRFHFRPWQERFIEMEVKERQDEAVKISQLPTAVDSFHAREHAISLIHKGNFAGAYGAVKHLENDEYENHWVQKVKDVSDYFGGQLEYRDDLSDYLKDFAKSESPRCLLVAMRTEAALLSHRIADAISLTCTFLDAAILDAITSFQHQNKPSGIDEDKIQMHYSANHQIDDRLRQNKCLTQQGRHYRYNVLSQCTEIWLEVMNQDQDMVHFMNYHAALGRRFNGRVPKHLRNANTHSLLKTGRLNQAKDVFVRAGFWATDAEQPIAGSCFLAQPLVDNVLTELGESEVSKRYAELIEGVCGELVKALG